MSEILTYEKAQDIFNGVMNGNYDRWVQEGVHTYSKKINNRYRLLIDNDVCSVYDDYDRVWRFVSCVEFDTTVEKLFLCLNCEHNEIVIPIEEDNQ